MRIFITGATGFIGRHVIEEVHALGHDILASTLEKDKIENRPEYIHWIYGDLANLEFLTSEVISFNPDVIIHLAWQGIPDFSAGVCQKNLNDSINFFDWALENTKCKKVIVSSSCFEYGKKHGVCKESDPVNIDSYFTWAKHSLYQYSSVKCTEKDVTLNWFRIFYVYGPGQREGSLIPTLIKSIGAKETPRINTPLNKNDFVYVENVAKAFAKAVDINLTSGVYNLGSGKATSVYDICRIVENQLLNTETISKEVKANGRQSETVNFWADMTKTKKAFSILDATPLEEGIELCVQSMEMAIPT